MRFWDRNKHMSWLKANLAARRIHNDPSALSHLRRHLDAWRDDPRNALSIRVWDDILAQGPEAVVQRITALNDAGELARDTMPPGIVLDESEITACIAERRRQEAKGLVVYGSDG
jgi:hypothetical protein